MTTGGAANGGSSDGFLNGGDGQVILSYTEPASAAPEPAAVATWAFAGPGLAGLVLAACKKRAAASPEQD